MDGCHQTGSIPPNIEDREFSHLICGGENGPQFRKRCEIAAFHLSVPVFQSTEGLWMSGSKLVQPFPGDDMQIASRVLRNIFRRGQPLRHLMRAAQARLEAAAERTLEGVGCSR